MDEKSKVLVFIDDASQPLGQFDAPVHFDFDTRKLVDGQHTFKVVSKDPSGKEGILLVPFIVRNGPAISIEGLKQNEVVDGVLMIKDNSTSTIDITNENIDSIKSITNEIRSKIIS